MTTTSTTQLVDRSGARAEYHAETDARHFVDGSGVVASGSRFTNPALRRIEDVLDVVLRERGTLEGDDREKFFEHGADKSWFLPNVRYLYVNEGGTVDAVHSFGMAPNMMVEVKRLKSGSSCTLVRYSNTRHVSDFGVVIIETDPATGEEFVATTHPGVPRSPNSSPALEALEAQHLSIAQVREILGRDFWIETMRP